MNEVTKRKLFKDWFDEDAAVSLAEQFQETWSSFPSERFLELATQKLSRLEFHARIQQFARALALCLPQNPPEALALVTASLPPVIDSEESVNGGWLQWPLGQFIADRGLPHFEESFQAMTELTKRFSSEFAVRPFVERYPQRSFERLLSLTGHPNPHVRRWCSEGVRPLLPWGKKLKDLVANPAPIWPILDALKDDPVLYVRRSVANNLNDISKNHPDLVLARCQEWSQDKRHDRDRLIGHALRTLIKEGHPEALSLLGFQKPEALELQLVVEPESLSIGESVVITLSLNQSTGRTQNLLIDYVVEYVRQKGKVSSKVFKWTKLRLEPQGPLTIKKKHPVRETTIRALYPGFHRIAVQINGERLAEASFELKPA